MPTLGPHLTVLYLLVWQRILYETETEEERERERGGGEEKVRWREKVKFLEFRVVSH